MGFYHVAQVCLNGHLITDSMDQSFGLSTPFCSKCGAPTITACPSCNAPLHGDYDCGIPVIGTTTSVDAYCYQCGKPYPWTESALQSAKQLIMEEDSIAESDKTAAIESLPDIVSETPNTNLAVVRMKKIIASAGKFTSDAIRKFIIDFGCKLAIQMLTS